MPTCCRLDFLFRAEFAMHRSLSAAIPARSMVITLSRLWLLPDLKLDLGNTAQCPYD
jgi:hypothetical protein